MEATVAQLAQTRQARAQQIAAVGDLGVLGRRIDTTISEALVLGLWLQGVRTFFCVFGHGSTELGEVLRIYQDAGLVRVCGVRSEIEASHAAAALRWVRGEKAAVVTSIGPGALQALAASIVPRSDGLGVWYLLGDETTQDEGPNMQQIPGSEQNAFLRLFGTMSRDVLAAHAAGACHRAPARTQRGGASAWGRTVFLALAAQRATSGAGAIQFGRTARGRTAAVGSGRR